MGFDQSTYFFYSYESAFTYFPEVHQPLHEFRGFNKVPDNSKIIRFKQDFLQDIQVFFRPYKAFLTSQVILKRYTNKFYKLNV